MKIQSARIQRFKRISDATFSLKDINVLVGANSSGKSSFIQAFHFAVSILQTLALTKRFGLQHTFATSISPDELIYSPAEDPYSLAEGGKLIENPNRSVVFEFVLDSGEQFGIKIRKGRITNIIVDIINSPVARSLSSLDAPFSIFSPGLAGVARSENYVSDGMLLRVLARGDANLVLRNILYRLWGQPAWAGFQSDLSYLFPDVVLEIAFDSKIDEYIDAWLIQGARKLPLELAGTGLLQAIQILAYIHRFSPSLVVLDEPDSHLHPNNQRLICSLLASQARERGIQILMTTHSRHVIDALSGEASFLWVQNGKTSPAEKEDEVGILMEIGALDVKERISHGQAKVIVLTEDRTSRPIKELCEASGFIMTETLVLEYSGVTNLHNLRPLIKHIRDLTEAAIVLHRDRDYLFNDEVEQWKTDVRSLGVEPFVTDYHDIDSYFANVAHLERLNGVGTAELQEIVNAAMSELNASTIEAYINGRIDIERKSGNFGRLNVGRMAVEARKAVEADLRRFVDGKQLIGAIRRRFRESKGENLSVYPAAAELALESLRTISQSISGPYRSSVSFGHTCHFTALLAHTDRAEPGGVELLRRAGHSRVGRTRAGGRCGSLLSLLAGEGRTKVGYPKPVL